MLSDAKARAAKAAEKAYKLSGQRYRHVSTTGVRSWRMKYQLRRPAPGKPVQS